MCLLNIKGWYGRAGNNFITIMNALHMNSMNGNKYRVIQWPNHQCFKVSSLTFEEGCVCGKVVTYNAMDIYFCKVENISMEQTTMRMRRNMANRYKHRILCDDILKDINTVSFDNVIHIRSGDTAHMKGGMYGTYPLEYYTNFIENVLCMDQNQKVCIVYEDDRLQTMKSLKEKYGKNQRIIWQSSSVINDINTIVRAKKLLTSPGTFSAWIPYMFSDTLETMYLNKNRIDGPPMIIDENDEIPIQWV